MKTVIQTTIWTILIFIGLTLLTMKEQAEVDGINAYGFPLTFYNYFEGKCNNCYYQYGFKLFSLLADIGIVAVIVLLAIRLKNKIFKKATLLIFATISLISCGQTQKQEPNKTSENNPNKINWYDELVLKYINQTDNQLVRLAIKDKYSEDWVLDRRENTGGAYYLIFHIGHDLTDEGNTDQRFTTDCWLYIDSLTRKIYEYDLPNDSLIEWKK